MSPHLFSTRLIAWQLTQGRHGLPWQGTAQNPASAYAVWVSEIMLQQTQVATVIGYYQKFMRRFPTVQALARAQQSEVLQYWSGLGYYARARNLHHAAQTVEHEWGGEFLISPAQLQTLKGVGKSTAAAIAVFAKGQRAAILDGNVKRVLARHQGIAGWAGDKKIETQLWQAAENLLPSVGASQADLIAYTQGLMDLGAGPCKRGKPNCGDCPVAQTCVAYAQGLTTTIPASRPKKNHPTRQVLMPILRYKNQILLQRRVNQGIWGGLLSLPEFLSIDEAEKFATSWNQTPTQSLVSIKLNEVRHSFTHFTLQISPFEFHIKKIATQARAPEYEWLDLSVVAQAELPAPIKKLLLGLAA